MADNFISWPNRQIVGGDLMLNDVNLGTSSTAADYFEVRYTTGVGITRKDFVLFLESMIVFVQRGGVLGDGTGVPPPN